MLLEFLLAPHAGKKSSMVGDSLGLYDVRARNCRLLENHRHALSLDHRSAIFPVVRPRRQSDSPPQRLVQPAGAQKMLNLRNPVVLWSFIRTFLQTGYPIRIVELLNPA